MHLLHNFSVLIITSYKLGPDKYSVFTICERQSLQEISHVVHYRYFQLCMVFIIHDRNEYIYLLLLLSTNSLDPCLWEESDHPAFGPPAS